MFDAGRRPMGRLFYWLLAVVAAFGFRVSAGAAPVPQSGPASTTVAEVQLVELREGQTEIKTLIQAQVVASKKIPPRP
jgi:hypothetical protein